MIFDDFRVRDSALVQAALERKCAVCPAKSGEECRDLADDRTLFEAVGRYVHLMRGDGLPYSPKKAS